jgi:hypothetical protein
VADATGWPLLPWVRRAMQVSTEYHRESGLPVRSRVLWTVPRQCGKSVGLSSYTIERCMREEGTYGIYVAQSREAARKRLRNMALLLNRSRLDLGARFKRGVGNEALEFSNGSLIELAPPTEQALMGDSLDIALVDEIYAIPPNVLYGTILPAMAARPEAQVLMISTAGTLESTLLNELRQKGRENPQGRMAFVEYGKPEEIHAFDEDSWRDWHPGLGETIALAKMREAADEEPLPEFLRAWCNVTTAVADPVWPADWWQASATTVAVPDEISIGIDSTSAGASIMAGWQAEGGWHGDLIEYREGSDVDWIPERLAQLFGRFSITTVGMEHSGPIGMIEPEIRDLCELERVPLRGFGRSDRCKADQWLYETLKAKRLTHGKSEALDDSQGATPARKIGDRWLFDRDRAIIDPSPIIALSMAVYSAYEAEILNPKPGIFWG